jgi:ABC-type glycerol-3-phosphate transport system substrate-binding protein
MLAANNAPDVCKSADMNLIKTYIAGGGITDLTPYVDQYSKNIK